MFGFIFGIFVGNVYLLGVIGVRGMMGLYTDSEFKLYLKNLEIVLRGVPKKLDRYRKTKEFITKYSGEEIERCFTETQLRFIFSIVENGK